MTLSLLSAKRFRFNVAVQNAARLETLFWDGVLGAFICYLFHKRYIPMTRATKTIAYVSVRMPKGSCRSVMRPPTIVPRIATRILSGTKAGAEKCDHRGNSPPDVSSGMNL